MQINVKSKRAQAIIVTAVAAMLVLSGAFAWYSFSQNRINTFDISISTPNVNLHDDFAGGPEKDVYVENSGDFGVLVRVRLSELIKSGNYIVPENAVDTDYGTGWHIHTPSSDGCGICDFEAHKYFTWFMDGQKFYMPAHDSAKGSTDAEPVAVGDKETIIDYAAMLQDVFTEIYAGDQNHLDTILALMSEYSGGDNTGAAMLMQEIEKIPDTYTVSIKQYAGQPEDEFTRKLNEVKLTLIPSQIITMHDWITGDEPFKTGDFWVMDDDGWCYWANILAPDTATGQLLNAVNYKDNYSGEDFTYKINVHLNATSLDGTSFGTFFLVADQNGGISEQGMILMMLTSEDYIFGEDGEFYLRDGGGMYRKVIKNSGSYKNFTLGSQIYAKPGNLPGGDDGFSVDGQFSLDVNGNMTGGGEYIIEYIATGDNGVIYLDVGGGNYIVPVDANGNPDNDGSKYAIVHPGADGVPGTNKDVGPIRADGQYPQWYLTDIADITDGDVIEAGQKGVLVRADSASEVPLQGFSAEQSVYKVQAIVRGVNGLLYFKLDEELYAVALNIDGTPVNLTMSEAWVNGEPERVPEVYYIVYPGENGIGTGGDAFEDYDINFAGGQGTEAEPYLIATKAQLEYMRDMVNADAGYSVGKYFRQIADIDLEDELWTPIGVNVGYTFKGVYDGGGYTINGLNVNSNARSGLFGYLSGATVKNLSVEGSITSTNSGVGGIAGDVNSGSIISDCVFSGTVTGTSYTGGIAGIVVNNSHIERCFAAYDSKVICTSVAGGTGGGIFGVISSVDSSVNSCYSLASVTASSQIGGIVGSKGPGTVTNCAFLRTSQFNNGMNAHSGSGSSTNVGYFEDLGEPLTATNGAEFSGTLIDLLRVGEADSAWVQHEAPNLWTLPDVIRDHSLGYYTPKPGDPNYAGGNGSAQYPYQISNKQQLEYMRDQVNAGTDYTGIYFIQTADIDLLGENWTPIGAGTTAFNSAYNGGGHKISRLYVNDTVTSLGLFGGISGGTVEALSVEGTVISTSNSVGGIAGFAIDGAIISNCVFSGTVKAYSSVGGIVGNLWKFSGAPPVVKNCYVTYGSKIESTSTYTSRSTGGIVGVILGGAALSDSYSLAEVTGVDTVAVGGVVGSNNGSTVTNCAFVKTAALNSGLDAVGVGTGTNTNVGCFSDLGSTLTATNDTTVSGTLVDLLDAGAEGSGKAWIQYVPGGSWPLPAVIRDRSLGE